MKQWNKKGILIRTWIISFLLFSGTCALLFSVSQNLADDYDRGSIIQDKYDENYNVFNETADDYRGLYEEMGEEDSGVLDILFGDAGIIRAVFSTITITFSSIKTINQVAVDFTEDFGVPRAIANIIFPLLLGIIMIIFIFAVISSINRGNKL